MSSLVCIYVSDLNRNQTNKTPWNSEDDLLSLENAFDAKRYKYKAVGKQFFAVKNGPIHGSANDLSAIFIERYELLLQRTLRHKAFRKSNLDFKHNQNKMYCKKAPFYNGIVINENQSS